MVSKIFKMPKHNAFALIYALMIITLISITLAAMASFMLIGFQQSRQTVLSAEAYQMAQSAIEEGIANYRLGTSSENCSSSTAPETKVFDDSLTNTTYKYKIYYCTTSSPPYIKGVGTAIIGVSTTNSNTSNFTLRADLSGSGMSTKVDNIYQVGS